MSAGSDRLLGSLAAGLAGAVAVTVLHEAARRVVSKPPRMDTLGRRGIARTLHAVGVEPPRGEKLQAFALAGDLASNGVMYALVGLASPALAPIAGATIGALAGAGAVVLPPVLDLGPGPDKLAKRTQAMTVAWYTFGGLVAGEVYRRMRGKSDD